MVDHFCRVASLKALRAQEARGFLSGHSIQVGHIVMGKATELWARMYNTLGKALLRCIFMDKEKFLVPNSPSWMTANPFKSFT